MLEKDNNLMAGKGEWNEADHPRDSEGKFTSNGGGQSTNSQVKSENQSTKKEPRTLSSQVDEVLNGTNKDAHVMLSEETPQILQDIGVPNKPIFMTSKHTYLAINESGKYNESKDHYHNLGKELFLAIPKLLESPAIVLQQKGDKDIVAVLNWYDKDKNILICPIRINGTAQYNKITIEGNIAKSIYGKENFRRYINKNFKQKDILAIGKKKIRDIHH
ncbi:hypothetical protein IKA92_07455 [bacterium]|nr:hypothetical protein [bacterium]MBR2387113.1 hypothetical protein [bacterium]